MQLHNDCCPILFSIVQEMVLGFFLEKSLKSNFQNIPINVAITVLQRSMYEFSTFNKMFRHFASNSFLFISKELSQRQNIAG